MWEGSIPGVGVSGRAGTPGASTSLAAVCAAWQPLPQMQSCQARLPLAGKRKVCGGAGVARGPSLQSVTYFQKVAWSQMKAGILELTRVRFSSVIHVLTAARRLVGAGVRRDRCLVHDQTG